MSRRDTPQPVEQSPAAKASQAETAPGRARAIPPTIKTFAGLPVTQLEFALRAEVGAELPNFLGSTLRGAFGHALKRAACLSPSRDCLACPLPHDCWYAWMFETEMPPRAMSLTEQRDAPRPFVLTPPLDEQWGNSRRLKPGAEITFALTLFGAAAQGALYAAQAISEMARSGLGAQRAKFALREIFALDPAGGRTPLGYDENTGQFNLLEIRICDLSDFVATRLATITPSERIKLRFLTRARLRAHDQLQDEFSFATLIRFLWRRVSLMLAIHGDRIPEIDKEAMLQRADGVSVLASAMIKHEVWRRSNRQRRKLPQDGFLGEILYEGEDLPGFLPLLVAGELLHVGSGATFGLGKYKIIS